MPGVFPGGLVKGHGQDRPRENLGAQFSQRWCTSTLVLLPAPVSTSMLPFSAATAARWASFRGENTDTSIAATF